MKIIQTFLSGNEQYMYLLQMTVSINVLNVGILLSDDVFLVINFFQKVLLGTPSVQKSMQRLSGDDTDR